MSAGSQTGADGQEIDLDMGPDDIPLDFPFEQNSTATQVPQETTVKIQDERSSYDSSDFVRPYPVLSENALFGLPGRLVQTLDPHTEADRAAILIQLLLGVGNLIGRSPFYLAGAVKHHPNLFACIVGKSSKARKGTSWAYVQSVLESIDPDWVEKNLASGLSSGEGLIWAVRDPLFKPARDDETGQVTDVLFDPGIEDKRLYVAESEFSQAFKVMSREGNTLSETLRAAWDTGNLNTMVKNSPAKATNSHITICGHITQEELKRRLSECEFFNGFANRFLWVCSKRSKLLPDGGRIPHAELAADLDLLRRRIMDAKTITQMQRDEAAARLWAKIYEQLSIETVGLAGAATDRSEAQLLRLSMVYALFEGSAIITVQHLRAAQALWQYCSDSVLYLFGDQIGDPKAQKILDALRKKPNGMTRSEISEQVFNKNMPSDQISAALALLNHNGFAHFREEQTYSGRSAERWFADR
jgi:hypothetical protein